MNKLTSKERVLRALALKEVDRIPWMELGFHGKIAEEIIGEEVIKNTGFHSLENPDEYEKYLKQMVKLAKKIGLDALHLKCWAPTGTFIETITTSGSKVYQQKGKIKDERALEKLAGEFLENCQKQRKQILQCAEIFDKVMEKEEIARGYTIGGVFSESWMSMGLENFCISLRENPALVKDVVSLFNNFYNGIIEEIIHQFRVDFVWSTDDLAFKTGPFISPEQFREFVLPYFKRTKEIIGDIPWVLHSDGDISSLIEDLIKAGIKGFHPMEPLAVDIFEVKKKYGNRICVIGNLDVDLIDRGSKRDVEKEAKRLMENLGPKGYIFSSGNSITEWAKVENVLTISKTLKGGGEKWKS